jgi:hypothetical protein
MKPSLMIQTWFYLFEIDLLQNNCPNHLIRKELQIANNHKFCINSPIPPPLKIMQNDYNTLKNWFIRKI